MAEKESTTSGGKRTRESRSSTERAKGEAQEAVAEATPTTGPTRTATVNLPFVTAEFRAPEVHLPSRADVNSAVRRAGGLLPSRTAAIYYGGLAATALVGLIEWPVAAAIGVGTALASRGEARPEPSGRTAESSQG